jgi:hypothetical protein
MQPVIAKLCKREVTPVWVHTCLQRMLAVKKGPYQPAPPCSMTLLRGHKRGGSWQLPSASAQEKPLPQAIDMSHMDAPGTHDSEHPMLPGPTYEGHVKKAAARPLPVMPACHTLSRLFSLPCHCLQLPQLAANELVLLNTRASTLLMLPWGSYICVHLLPRYPAACCTTTWTCKQQAG